MNNEIANKIVEKTIADYNRISALWSTKRFSLPSDMREMAKWVNNGEKILDYGCGNGIFYEAIKDRQIDYLGMDTAEGLINIAKERFPKGNFETVMPFHISKSDKAFDKVFCLSVIHHIPTFELRKKFLLEIKNVIKNSGKLILTAWQRTEQMDQYWDKNHKKFDSLSLEENDLIYPMKDSSARIQMERYIHCFEETEMIQLLESCGFAIEKCYSLPRNRGKYANIVTISHIV